MVLQAIAEGIVANRPDALLLILLVDERPGLWRGCGVEFRLPGRTSCDACRTDIGAGPPPCRAR
jgi:hypothetical protein